MNGKTKLQIAGVALLLLGGLIAIFLYQTRIVPADKVSTEKDSPFSDAAYWVTVKKGAWADPDIWVSPGQGVEMATSLENSPFEAALENWMAVEAGRPFQYQKAYTASIFTIKDLDAANNFKIDRPTKLYLRMNPNSNLEEMKIRVEVGQKYYKDGKIY